MILYRRKEKILALNNTPRYPLEEPNFFLSLVPRASSFALRELKQLRHSFLSCSLYPSGRAGRKGEKALRKKSLLTVQEKLINLSPLSFSTSSHFLFFSNTKNKIKESPFLKLWKRALAGHSKSTQNSTKYTNGRDQIKFESKISNFKGPIDILQSTSLWISSFSQKGKESKEMDFSFLASPLGSLPKGLAKETNQKSWINQGISRKKKNLFIQKKAIKRPNLSSPFLDHKLRCNEEVALLPLSPKRIKKVASFFSKIQRKKRKHGTESFLKANTEKSLSLPYALRFGTESTPVFSSIAALAVLPFPSPFGREAKGEDRKQTQKKFERNPYINQNSYDFRTALRNRLIPREYSLETFHRSNQDTCLLHNPAVFEGDWVQSGDLLADCAASSGGELSLGKNILIAYMPWEGYNFEDAILISERLVFEDVYSSIHIERYDVEIRETKYGMETITRNIPELNQKELEHLDSNGVAKLGSWIQEGDVLVGRVTPINKKIQSTYKNLLFTILQTKPESVRDSSLRAPRGMKGKIVNVQRLKKTVTLDTSPLLFKTKNEQLQSLKSSLPFLQKNNKKPKKVIKKKLRKIKNSLESEIELDKRVVSTEAVSDLSRKLELESFKGLLPLRSEVKGVASSCPTLRVKEGLESKVTEEGQINIVYVYLAEKRRIQVGDKMAGRHGNKGIVSQVLPRQDMPFLANGTPLDMVLNPLGVPSRMNVGQIYECLLGLAAKYLGEHYKIFPFDEKYGPEASRSFVYSKLNEARKKTGSEWLFNPNCPGKTRLFDGRTGDPFDQSVTVGYAYMLKLVHLVDDKIHMRSTGPYSLVTQQPLRGRSKQGGQRLGEMEVWALEGYGAAFTLLEMLTIKSDDMTGRMTLWSNLILNKDLSIGTPESFKVLVCELQALCLDIGIFRVDSVGNLSEIESLTELP